MQGSPSQCLPHMELLPCSALTFGSLILIGLPVGVGQSAGGLGSGNLDSSCDTVRKVPPPLKATCKVRGLA